MQPWTAVQKAKQGVDPTLLKPIDPVKQAREQRHDPCKLSGVPRFAPRFSARTWVLRNWAYTHHQPFA